MEPPAQLIYLHRGRLHRLRANVIQTLHTLAAMHRLGCRAELNVPPWRRGATPARVLEDLGLDEPLEIRASPLLHPRFRFRAFVRWHRRRLAAAPALYTRAPEISRALLAADLPHHLELHDFRALEAQAMCSTIAEAHAVGRIGHLFPISHAIADALRAAGADPARIHVAPSGVNVEAYASVPPLDPARLEQPRVVYVGTITASRGLRVFEALADRGLCRPTLVGHQPEATTASDAIQVRPFVAPRDVPRLYDECDLVLLPYQHDLQHADSISPIKLFEAMAAGRPIIASDLPTIREVIEHEVHGLLVPPDDIDGWAAAVQRLRDDHTLARRLADRARAEANRYSWTHRAITILEPLDLLPRTAARDTPN